jgi:hypothetical protein
MTSSRSSSSSALLAAAALALAACAHGAPRPPEPPARRLALFPAENLTGRVQGVKDLNAAVERALAAAGVEVVTGDAVQQFLFRHRIRYTAGIGGSSAAAAKEELGVDGITLTAILQYENGAPPRLAVIMRIVSAEEVPRIQWMGRAAMSGDDNPGFLSMGLVETMPELQRLALEKLTGSLAAFLAGGSERSAVCSPGVGLHWAHRSSELDGRRGASVVVLPFANRTSRRGAGEVVALELVSQLAAVPGVDLIESGMVRDEILSFRMVMPEGPSLDDLFAIEASIPADLFVAGEVLDFVESQTGTPRLGFAVNVLDARTRRVVWRSSSSASGTDRVLLFGLGRESTASELACLASRGVVAGLFPGGKLPSPAQPASADRPEAAGP